MIVNLFAGPGGLCLGSERAGESTVGIEWDVNAVATRCAAGLPTVHGDVRTYGPKNFPKARRLAGGPPCQTYTVAGDGSGRAEIDLVLTDIKRMAARDTTRHSFGDDRTALVLEPLRWILEAVDAGQPYEAIVLEQVPAVMPVWNAYAAALEEEGYGVATGILRTEQYGVPQTRRRAVLVARHGADVQLPAPTHRPYRKGVPQHEGDPSLLPWVSMADILPDRGPFTVISNYGTGGDPKNRGRRTSAEPAFTVTGKVSRNRLVDTDGRELERFTHAEAGRLQGFPAAWPWTGRDIPQQIGNACPVQLAQALLAALRTAAPAPAP